jgi:DNA-binding IclR family transcriptional regulator
LWGRVPRQHLLLTDTDDAGTYRIADVAAPVFDASGTVALVVAVSGLDDGDLRGTEIRELGAHVAATADALTAAVQGRPPEDPASGAA